MLFDAWFAPPAAPRRVDGATFRDEAGVRRPAPFLPVLSYRPPIRVPRFVWGLLPHAIGPSRGR